MTFSPQEIRDLAEAERMMDSGEIGFVHAPGGRMMVSNLIMEELGLKQGQTVCNSICSAIMEASLSSLKAEIALRDISDTKELKL